MDPYTLKRLNDERAARRACVVVTELATGRTRLVAETDPVAGLMGEKISAAMRSGVSRLVEDRDNTFFLNAHVPKPRIVAIGAVHITQALAPIAKAAGFELTIVDPRTAFATQERFEGCHLRAQWPEDALVEGELDAYTALVAVTHDPKIDDWPIAEALRKQCFYVGALGSRKTHAKRLERLAGTGLSDETLARIHAPIGLDIGASSPAEIAVAVMAEIVLALRGPKRADA